MRKRKMFYLLVLIISIVMLTGCGLGNSEKTIASYNNIYEVTVNGDWVKADKGALNAKAELELKGLRTEKYVMILTDKASNFESYDDWCNNVISNNSNNYSFDESDVKQIKIADFDSKYVETEKEYNNTKMYMRIYFLNGKDNYSQLFMWTEVKNKDKVASEFDQILESLKYN